VALSCDIDMRYDSERSTRDYGKDRLADHRPTCRDIAIKASRPNR
jgi:hypothetical protein